MYSLNLFITELITELLLITELASKCNQSMLKPKKRKKGCHFDYGISCFYLDGSSYIVAICLMFGNCLSKPSNM